MRIFFIGMFIIALLAGLAAQQLNRPSSDQQSWLGHAMNAVGLKDRERAEKAQFDEIAQRFVEQKAGFTQHLKDQQQYLEDSKTQMASLMQTIKDRLDRDSNTDLLRLKDLLQQHQDQAALLIDRGKESLQLNEQRMKIPQVMQDLKEKLDHQNDLMKQRMADSEALRDKMQQIKDQIQAMHDQTASKEIFDKSQAAFDKLKEEQERLRETNQQNSTALNAMKEKIDDLKQRNRDLVEQSRERMRDQQQLLKDRLQDQRDRMQDQRNK